MTFEQAKRLILEKAPKEINRSVKSQIVSAFKERGISSMNGSIFTEENHNSNNRVILHLKDILNGYSCCGAKRIIGYTAHPSYAECNGWGIMFEAIHGDDFWCHVDEEMLALELNV